MVFHFRAEAVVDVPNGGPEEDKVGFVGKAGGYDVGDDFVGQRTVGRARLRVTVHPRKEEGSELWIRSSVKI